MVTLSVSQLVTLLTLSSSALGAPNAKRAQQIWMAGDSTMARASDNTQGWGVYFPNSVNLPVQNRAIGGRSARSYTVEGRFDTLINSVQPNDIVIIEFGHNDGGSLSSSDNGRTACPGAGDEVCTSTFNGQTVQVLTYPKYLTNAGQALVAKGAKVIVSSPTPNNPWEGGSFVYTPNRFTGYARTVAERIGPNAFFVDHGQYTANIFQSLGKARVDSFFPNDHTHTSPEGADVVHKAFVKGVLCAGGSFLAGHLKNTTGSVQGSCI